MSFSPIWFCRSVAAKLLYLAVKYGLPTHARLVGYKRAVFGKCTIIAPAEKIQSIIDGIHYLETLDPQMFQRLTHEQEYVFWYHQKRFLSCENFYSITDNFLLWGKEGIAIFFVQSILDFNLRYLPSRAFSARNHTAKSNTVKEVQRKLFDWIQEHHFPAELADQYDFSKLNLDSGNK
jgi:hypothetical protein